MVVGRDSYHYEPLSTLARRGAAWNRTWAALLITLPNRLLHALSRADAGPAAAFGLV